MGQARKGLGWLGRRMAVLCLLAAFLVPPPAQTPQDTMRAEAIALGLLCVSDDGEAPHRDGHCVLCLLPASSSPPDLTCGPALAGSAAAAPVPMPRVVALHARPKTHEARAPPSRSV